MSQDSEITTIGGCLARVFWVILGPVLFFLCAIVIASNPQVPIPSILDIIYAGLLVATIIARLVDQPPKPTEPSGNQIAEKGSADKYQTRWNSTIRYIIILLVASISLWAVAHFVIKW